MDLENEGVWDLAVEMLNGDIRRLCKGVLLTEYDRRMFWQASGRYK